MPQPADQQDGPVGAALFRLRQFNRKVPAPSLRMHAPDGGRYRCPWIEDSITVHSDGNVTCGLDDPNGQRSFGNITVQPVAEIFGNPEYERLRTKLWNGHRCMDCTLYQRIEPEAAGAADALRPRPAMPSTLVVEPTIRCNIRCLNEACYANNDAAVRTRDADMLPYDAFACLVDQVAAGLRYVYFFNYGDPFVHAQAEDMLLYLRQACPDVEVVSSTNGIPLAKPARAGKVVQSGLNTIVFTISGITQESYAKYHVGGKVELALRGMTNVLAARSGLGATRPVVVWRYLLFRWNDSTEEIDAAIQIARDHGVDIMHLYLTHVPPEGSSFRFAPGTPNFVRYRSFIECALDYTRLIVQPDASGQFAEENIAELGHARWTSYKATVTRNGQSGWIPLMLATMREAARDRPTTVFVVTPWDDWKVSVPYMGWQVLVIPVPEAYRGAPVAVDLATPDYWWPAEEYGSSDMRCLGVLVRSETDYAPHVEAAQPATVLALTEGDRTVLAGLAHDAAKPLTDFTSGRLGSFHADPS